MIITHGERVMQFGKGIKEQAGADRSGILAGLRPAAL